MAKTAVVRAWMKNGDISEYREDCTDTMNEGSSAENCVERAARNSGLAAHPDFLEWNGGEVVDE
jgi:hypothetical protein